jgi:hypothetical protein
MSNLYYIHANISGIKKWHLVYDKQPGLYFIEEDFEEEEYDIELYREEFTHNEVIEVPDIAELKELWTYKRALKTLLEREGEAMKNDETKKCKCDYPYGSCEHDWIRKKTKKSRAQPINCRKCGMTWQKHIDEIQALLEFENLQRIM